MQVLIVAILDIENCRGFPRVSTLRAFGTSYAIDQGMMRAARYTTQTGRAAHSTRPRRESFRKRLGRRADRIAERDGNRCVYCGATARSSGRPLSFDHLTPRSLGGTDHESNIVLCCMSCNSRRQAKPLAVWARVAVNLSFTARSIRAQARRRLPQ